MRGWNSKPLPPMEVLKAAFAYNPETGALTYNQAGPRKQIGAEAGCIDPQGYRRVHLGARNLMAHRVCYALGVGRDKSPLSVIDHINGNRADNRLCNLREITPRQNAANRKANQQSGMPKGVKKDHRLYTFRINNKGKMQRTGGYLTAGDAAIAYDAAARSVIGPFCKTNAELGLVDKCSDLERELAGMIRDWHRSRDTYHDLAIRLLKRLGCANG